MISAVEFLPFISQIASIAEMFFAPRAQASHLPGSPLAEESSNLSEEKVEKPSYLVYVQTLSGNRFEIQVSGDTTAGALKEEIRNRYGIVLNRLIFLGKLFSDDNTCDKVKITAGCVIHGISPCKNGRSAADLKGSDT